MSGDYEKGFESGTERGRSPSGVPDSGGSELGHEAPAPKGEARSATRLSARRRGVSPYRKSDEGERAGFSPEERLLILDTWRRSALPAGDFAPLVGLSPHTLYQWKRRFETHGPSGLLDQPRGGAKGSRLPDLTRRTILMLKESNPDWGCQRISDMLVRGPALPASPGAVARVLREEGYVLEESPTAPHPDKPREFERARPNQLWQTDLFTFMLKRQNRRVHFVAFMDDHSRFITCYGLHATASAALVIEVLRSGIASYQSPEEILTDNGPQYITWRGKSAFSRELEKRGIRQIVSRPRHPQTLGKIERFWGTLWRECVESAVFLDLADAQKRIGLFIDHYNFQRPHQGIDHLIPADRFFGAAPEVLRALKERVERNALELARNGIPKKPFYLAGSSDGVGFSLHAEGERLIFRREDGERQEVELVPPGDTVPPLEEKEAEKKVEEASTSSSPPELPMPLCPSASPSAGVIDEEHDEVPPPGVSALDEGLKRLGELRDERSEGEELLEEEGGGR